MLRPIAMPQANGIAERLIRTLRRECLDHVIVVNERHPRHVLREIVRHYNEARPHQALELRVPREQPRASLAKDGRIVSRPVLGGLTHEYEREAAKSNNGTAQGGVEERIDEEEGGRAT